MRNSFRVGGDGSSAALRAKLDDGCGPQDTGRGAARSAPDRSAASAATRAAQGAARAGPPVLVAAQHLPNDESLFRHHIRGMRGTTAVANVIGTVIVTVIGTQPCAGKIASSLGVPMRAVPLHWPSSPRPDPRGLPTAVNRMNAAKPDHQTELPPRSEEALWNWPTRCVSALAEDLARICEQLAEQLRDDDGEPHGSGTALAADPAERATLNYLYGSALYSLAQRQAPDLLPQAVGRLDQALSLARQHAPERVVVIKSELYRAEHSLALLHSPSAAKARHHSEEAA
jgi:hypothetical protein